MLEKWKTSVDSDKTFGLLLTNLSKAFSCLDHELLIVKLNAYGFSLHVLKMLTVIFRVPKGLILELLISIFLADFYFIFSDIDLANFSEDNTSYLSAKNVDHLIESQERGSVFLFKW